MKTNPTEQGQATARPWKWQGTKANPKYNAYLENIETGEQILFCDYCPSNANAALIVRAVNLIEAHVQLEHAAKDVEAAWTGNGDMATAVDKILLALAALAKMKGEKS